MPEPEDDPYTRFLGLPPGRRPPHLYELLELGLFCSQPELIEHAVRKQFRRIKPYEDHADRSVREAIQSIMNRIATARVVLTAAELKEPYDTELAAQLGVDRDAVLRARLATPLPEHELRITAGPALVGERLRLPIDATVTIGSDPSCVMTLASGRMATLHCRLRYGDNNWFFEQVDLARPALVNETRTTRFVLSDGDAIDVGGYRLRFLRISEGPARTTPVNLPPLSLTMQAGPSIPETHFNALPPEALLVGHDETALWQLPHAMVSRHHCRIEPSGGIWTVTDLSSTNGTFVNEDRADDHYPLKHGDRMTIGPFEILVSFRR